MTGLRKAIWTKFAANQVAGTVYAAVSGQMRFGRVHPSLGWDMPWIVYDFVTDVAERTFGEKLERLRVQFSVFSDSAAQSEIEGIVAKLWALFDGCTLTFDASTYEHWWVVRLNSVGPFFMADESGTGGHWQHTTDYEVYAKEA